MASPGSAPTQAAVAPKATESRFAVILPPAITSAVLYLAASRLDIDGSLAVRGFARTIAFLYGSQVSLVVDDVVVTKRGDLLALTTSCLYFDLTACAGPWLLLAARSWLRGLALWLLLVAAVAAANLLRVGATLALSSGGTPWFLAHDLVDLVVWYSVLGACIAWFMHARGLSGRGWLLVFVAAGMTWDLASAWWGQP